MSGIELIARERTEQIEKHQKSIEYDVDNNYQGELMLAARALITGDTFGRPTNMDVNIWLHMVHKPYKERIIIAGAFCAAEIDRLNAIGG
jgi:hypothetical protein